MDWYPLYNSVRIAAASTVVVYFLGIFLANVVARAPRLVKGALDVILTLPLVLPPTVVGYLLLRVFGPKRTVGAWLLVSRGEDHLAQTGATGYYLITDDTCDVGFYDHLGLSRLVAEASAVEPGINLYVYGKEL